MSNDNSNEQGHAAPAFQVGDRVRFSWHGAERGGEIIRFRRGGRVDVSDLEGVYRDRYGYTVPVASLTLISRATPAASERIGACLVCEQYRTRAECCRVERDEACVYVCLVCGNAIDESDTGRQRPAASEPAAPAPTPQPAPDLQQVERSISVAFAAINDVGSLSTDQTEDVVCRALDAIGAALGDLRNAVRQLAQDHQARS